MTRVLWVSAWPPDRNLGGVNIRQAYLLDELARRAETHLLLAGTLEDTITRHALAGVVELPVDQRPPAATSAGRRMRTLWEGLVAPAPSAINALAAVRRSMRAHLADAFWFDVVVVDRIELAALAPQRHRNRWVLSLHNVLSDMAAHELPLAIGRRQRWFLRRQQAKATRYEHQAVRAYDVVVTVSADDSACFPGPSVVVPNGVDTSRYVPTPLPSQPLLVMTGSFDYLPNIDGARWLCQEVLPVVRERVPDVQLSLVGSNPDPVVEELGRLPGVTLHANVESMPPYLQQARVALVPLRVGTGTRLKALEAMASCRPVVGTTIGLAGLDVRHGEHALVCDDASTTVAAVVELLLDDGRAAAIAEAGRALVETRYRWQALAVDFADAVLA